MKNLITIIVLMASLCFSQDNKVWGTFSDLKWTGEGKDKVASWTGPAANNWWDGLQLTSVWPMDEGTGNILRDKVGGYDATLLGNSDGNGWTTIDGKTVLAVNTNFAIVAPGRIVVGDVYDLTANEKLLYGGWLRLLAMPTYNVDQIFGKGGAASAGQYRFAPFPVAGKFLSGIHVGTSYNIAWTAFPESNWAHIVCALDRQTKLLAVWTNGVSAKAINYATDSGIDYNTTVPFCLFGHTNNDNLPSGSVRDFFVKVNGTTNDIPAIYNATKAAYGK